ncbi:MAG: ribosome silencing factor [Saprospiraceae bacterium]|nr:ribosome silencing factor [Saprospiraceae bacterium]
MRKKNSSALQPLGDDQLNYWIIDAIQDIKGKNIIKIDLRGLNDSPTDYFIICEGDSSTQVKAISDNIGRKLRDKMGISPNHTEGMDGAKWILVDYFDTVVHVFYPETRAFYEIEELWGDAKFTQYENI